MHKNEYRERSSGVFLPVVTGFIGYRALQFTIFSKQLHASLIVILGEKPKRTLENPAD